jgi:hypothetical protein
MTEQLLLSGGLYTKLHFEEEGFSEFCCATYFRRFGHLRDGVENIRQVQNLIPGSLIQSVMTINGIPLNLNLTWNKKIYECKIPHGRGFQSETVTRGTYSF